MGWVTLSIAEVPLFTLRERNGKSKLKGYAVCDGSMGIQGWALMKIIILVCVAPEAEPPAGGG